MGLKLQGLAAKMAQLEHDAEFEAAKVDARIEEASANLPTVFSKAHDHIDGLQKNIGDVEAAFSAIESVTNGGPPLEDQKTEPPKPSFINLIPTAKEAANG